MTLKKTKQHFKIKDTVSKRYLAGKPFPEEGQSISYRKDNNGSLISKTFNSENDQDVIQMCFSSKGKMFRTEKDARKKLDSLQNTYLKKILKRCIIVSINISIDEDNSEL